MSQRKLYAAAEVRVGDADLHMTLAFIGAQEVDMNLLMEDLSDIPLPFSIEFLSKRNLSPNADTPAVLVMPHSPTVYAKICAFQEKYVESGHISDGSFTLHVTSKGHEQELLNVRSTVVRRLYVNAIHPHKEEPPLMVVTK